MIQRVIGGILLMTIGVLLALRPREVWKVTESWKQAGACEASPLFMRVMHIVGGVLSVIGALVCLGILK